MPQQSAYRCGVRRQAGRFDDDNENSSTKAHDNLSDKEPNPSSEDRQVDHGKLPYEAQFLGTVAGRLAQEIHDEFLVCKICLESYESPKCLACLHTFCSKCIDRHISAEVTYNKYTDYRHFTCPLCRKRTQLPLGGVKRLPDNFLISALNELVIRQSTVSSASSSSLSLTLTSNNIRQNGSSHMATPFIDATDSDDTLDQLPQRRRKEVPYGECEICSQVGFVDRGHSIEPTTRLDLGEPSLQRASSAQLYRAPQASAKCLDCNKLLCDMCVARHRATKVTKDHATFDLQSGKNISCKEHAGETVRFYCEACSVCICVLCAFNEHHEHEVTSFGEAVTTLRTQISSNVEKAEKRISDCHSWLQAVHEVADLVHTLESQIIETADHFIEVIQKQKQEMISDLHEFIGSKNMTFIERSKEREQNLEEAEHICQETSKYLEAQEIDMLIAKPELCSNMRKLDEMALTEEMVEHVPSEVYFRPGTVQLGYLTNDASGDPTEPYDYLQEPLSSSSSASSIELANRPCVNTTSTQTEFTLQDFASLINDNQAKTEVRPTRPRGCNTEPVVMTDQETNTRPRGIKVGISFTCDSPTRNSEELPSNLPSDQLDFGAMDNLTRARMRRKMKERCHTLDNGGEKAIQQAVVVTRNRLLANGSGADIPANRRYSSIDKYSQYSRRF